MHATLVRTCIILIYQQAGSIYKMVVPLEIIWNIIGWRSCNLKPHRIAENGKLNLKIKANSQNCVNETQ